jgi:hypothetical protein
MKSYGEVEFLLHISLVSVQNGVNWFKQKTLPHPKAKNNWKGEWVSPFDWLLEHNVCFTHGDSSA